MKLDFGETALERSRRLEQWHRWFAWYPVYVSSHDWRWFEVVRRQRRYASGVYDGHFYWVYQEIK